MDTDTGTAARPITTGASTPSGNAPISTWCWRSTTGSPQAIEDNVDITDTVAALDPDPLRYMWVDEGDGQIPAQLAKAAAVLDAAPQLAGQTRGEVRVASRAAATRPAPPSPPTVRHAGRLAGMAGGPRRPAGGRAEHGRPRRVTTSWSTGPRTCSARPRPSPPTASRGCSSAGPVAPGRRCGPCRFDDGRWSAPEPVSDTDGPSFNQEVVALRRRRPARVLAGPGRATGSPSSPGGGTAARGRTTVRMSEGAVGQRLGPDASPSTGRTGGLRLDRVRDGSYAVAVRRVDARGGAGPVRRLTGGSDYALHPSLATTADGRLWCAFDVDLGARPRRQRPHPAAAPARPYGGRPTSRTACGSRGAACRPSCCPR